MSLQVWLPLNGNVNNQGLLNNEPTVTTGSSYDDGKIGKCLNNNGSAYVNINSDIVINGEFTIALWVKMNSMDTAWARVFGFRKNNNSYLGLCNDNNQTRLGFHIYDEVNGERKGIMDSYIFSPTINKWEHIAITYRDGVCNCYFNGTLLRSYNLEYTLNNTYSGNTLFSNYSGGNKNNCCINDFRFYDHALSPLEIKKLSQGLVAHWPLSMIGGQNLVDTSESIIVPSNGATSLIQNGVKTNGINKDTYFFIPLAETLLANETYTLSFKAEGMPNDINWYFALGAQNASVEMYCGTVKIKNGCNVLTFSPKVDISDTIIMDDGSRPSSNLPILEMTYFKIEKGDKATPWIPNSADDAYGIAGFDDNIEYDVSGYGHNGTKSGVTYSSDTPRYYTSTYFDGLDDMILIQNFDISNVLNNQCTISFWIKPEGESGQRSIYFSAYSGVSWSLEKNTGNSLRSYWNANPDKTVATAIADDVWCHIVVVKNGQDSVKVYKDGILKGEITATHSNLNFATTWRIGRDTRSNDGTPYKGLMSDFRIYATAFSDDDVLALYNTPISLSSNGTLLTQGEYSEV